MKYLKITLYVLLLALVSEGAKAQSTTDPDSVCAGAMGKSYKVLGTPGSTYQWVVRGGTKVTGGTSDSITINWSSTPGIDTLKVVEFNVIGCPGDTIRLAVVRLVPPTVAISGTDSICLNSATIANKLKFTFTGLAPWTVSYTEDGAARTLTTSSTVHSFNSQVYTASGVKNYQVTALQDRMGCTGTYSGGAAVTVFPKPNTSLIRHY